MEELEVKYQKLAKEYAKLKSQVPVLRKAVLDEQAKNVELKETIVSHEQKLRKLSQETESLTFRNDQLTKRIAVLQQELQMSLSNKKGKSKQNDHAYTKHSGLDEELHQKILENAVRTISDKDAEISSYEEKVGLLESKILALNINIDSLNTSYMDKLKKLNKELESAKISSVGRTSLCNTSNHYDNTLSGDQQHWKAEADKWRIKYQLLQDKPDDFESMCRFYEDEHQKSATDRDTAISECESLWLENTALSIRLEEALQEQRTLQNMLIRSTDELESTNSNYQGQLDAMTECMASQNETITRQCDEIHMLRDRISSRK